MDFQERLRRVAPVERPVLLVGERGTGKEIAARRLHFQSKRWGQPFVALNCAALSPTLIEAELFGHEEGAFTGARRLRKGRFEAADKGTLFLDEISLIPMEAQEKILRVVEYGAFERVGGSNPVQADVRIIGATNANLHEEAVRGRFKPDLLDRLAFEILFLPPLRERQEDIPLLAHFFASRMAFELGKGMPAFTEEALDALRRHPWPGNIRELKNVVERAVYRSDNAVLASLDFTPFHNPWSPAAALQNATPGEAEPRAAAAGAPGSGPADPFPRLIREALDRGSIDLPEWQSRLESEAVEQALAAARHRQREAAARLGLTYHQFRALYRKHRDKDAPGDSAASEE